MDDNTDIVDRLRSMYYELSRRQASTPFGERSELDGIPALLYEAAIKIQDLQGNEIERLRKERDEARQLYCGAVEKIQHGITNETKRSVADFLGWDCFKENTDV
jgi:hypothetical protein